MDFTEQGTIEFGRLLFSQWVKETFLVYLWYLLVLIGCIFFIWLIIKQR